MTKPTPPICSDHKHEMELTECSSCGGDGYEECDDCINGFCMTFHCDNGFIKCDGCHGTGKEYWCEDCHYEWEMEQYGQ